VAKVENVSPVSRSTSLDHLSKVSLVHAIPGDHDALNPRILDFVYLIDNMVHIYGYKLT
jgi:hypothetical protein